MDYDVDLFRNYAAGRALTSENERLWMEVVSDLSPPATERILDLGCGTGRFARPMANRFAAEVVGVDPSRKMLRAAGDLVRARGAAESIPLARACCDLVFLSMVVHHLRDLRASAGEIARVLRPGGRALVRNCFSGRMDEICFFRFSPAALRAENARMPSVAAVENAFAAAGLAPRGLRRVRQPTDASLAAHYRRLRKRAMSTFRLMTETEIEEGLAAVERAVRGEREPTPVVEPIDVLVFEKAPSRA